MFHHTLLGWDMILRLQEQISKIFDELSQSWKAKCPQILCYRKIVLIFYQSRWTSFLHKIGDINVLNNLIDVLTGRLNLEITDMSGRKAFFALSCRIFKACLIVPLHLTSNPK